MPSVIYLFWLQQVKLSGQPITSLNEPKRPYIVEYATQMNRFFNDFCLVHLNKKGLNMILSVGPFSFCLAKDP